MFRYAVETERRFYLANDVKVNVAGDGTRPMVEVELHDAWVWDMYRAQPVRAPRPGGHVQGRERRGAPPPRGVAGVPVRTGPGTHSGVEHDRRALGAHGEELAARWYAAQGYVVLARNWRCRHGELDLVLGRARAGRVLRGEGPHHAALRQRRRGGDGDQAGPAAAAGGRVAGARPPTRPSRSASTSPPCTGASSVEVVEGAVLSGRRARAAAVRGAAPAPVVPVAAIAGRVAAAPRRRGRCRARCRRGSRGTGSASPPRRAAPGAPRSPSSSSRSLTRAGPTARGASAITMAAATKTRSDGRRRTLRYGLKPTPDSIVRAMETIEVTRAEGGIVTVTLNRPEKKNAITGQMWDELLETFHEIAGRHRRRPGGGAHRRRWRVLRRCRPVGQARPEREAPPPDLHHAARGRGGHGAAPPAAADHRQGAGRRRRAPAATWPSAAT